MFGRARVRYGPHRAQSAVFRPARGRGDAHPTMMLLHGGSWSWPYGRWLMAWIGRDARRSGWNTYNVSYRRLGRFGGGGGWPMTFDDVTAAFDAFLASRWSSATDGRVVVVGHSAGGHLALWLASERSAALAGVVSMGGPTDLETSAANPANRTVRQLVAGAPLAQRWRLTSPVARLPTGTRTAIVHGAGDSIVAAASAERYAELARRSGDTVEFRSIEDEGHRAALNPRSATWRTAMAIVERWCAGVLSVG